MREVELLRRVAAGMRDDVADPNNNRFPDEAVALAVADWLDTCANVLAGDAAWAVKHTATHGAVEVARAYLGEDTDA